MNKDEAMQQALELIERLNKHGWILADFEAEVYAAITALKTALEQQAEPPPEWPLIKNILAVFGLDAIAFVAAWKAAQQQAKPVQEPVGKVVEISSDGFRCEFSQRLAVGTKLYIAPPLPVQEPKKRCCDHDSDCSVHNGNALPVGPCDCSQTFISSPHLGIVVTVSFQLAVRELAKLVAENFGQMPRNDKWADKVLLVRDTFEAARNKGAKP